MIIYSKKSKFNDIRVEEDYPIRKLLFGHGSAQQQSAINLDNLNEHVYDYSLLAMSALLFVNNPANVLCIGLGGGTIPSHISRLFPKSNIDVLELDSVVYDIAKQYFLFKESNKTKVILGDALDTIKDLDKTYNMVFLDVYDTDYIPLSLMSLEFTKSIYNVMKASGVLSINTCNIHESFPSQLNTIKKVFGNNLWAMSGLRNIVSTTLFITKGDLKPLDIVGNKPNKIKITDDIINASIIN